MFEIETSYTYDKNGLYSSAPTSIYHVLIINKERDKTHIYRSQIPELFEFINQSPMLSEKSKNMLLCAIINQMNQCWKDGAYDFVLHWNIKVTGY